MAEYATIPLLAKPNAGMPELIDGQTVFNVEPEEFAEGGKKLGSKRYPGQSTASDEEKNADFRA